MSAAHAAIAEAFSHERERLWAICYRMTGSAPDADDLLQETFERALRTPPASRTVRAIRSWRPAWP